LANLKKAYKSTKLFLNMVIHDLRNPTAQIKFAIEFALENYEKANN
jgi:light-regulated signal transduction histidine kinase (bacteriophytochrome)